MERPSPANNQPKQTTAHRNDSEIKYILPVGRSGWAIAAGYLAFLNILFILSIVTAPVTLIFAYLGWRDIKKNPDKLGMGRIYFAVITSVLALLLLFLSIVL